MTEQESLILSLAEDYLANILPTELLHSMSTFFEQARYNLRYNSPKSAETAWLNKVKIVSTSQQLLPPKVDPTVFSAVSRALYHNQWLNLDYTNAEQIGNKIEVMPLGLAQQGTRLYLVCRYRDFDNERTLALHRMQSATASTISFTPPADFDLHQYDDDGRFGFGDGKKVSLSFNITKVAGHHLLESPLSEQQSITTQNDHFHVQATVVDSLHLKWWLRTFGDEVWNISKVKV